MPSPARSDSKGDRLGKPVEGKLCAFAVIREPVDDFRVLLEIRHGIDHPQHLHDAFHVIEGNPTAPTSLAKSGGTWPYRMGMQRHATLSCSCCRASVR